MHIFQNFVANVNHNRSSVECSGKEVIIKSKSIVPGVVYRGHYCGCCKTVGLRWPGATFMLRLSVAQAFLTPTKCHSSWNTNTNWVSVLHGEAFKINLADLLPLPLKISKKSAGFGGAPLHPSAENLLLWPRKISPTTAKKVLSDMSTQGCQNFSIMHWRSIYFGAHRPVGVCNIRTVTIRSEVWSVADSVSSTSKDVRQGDEECECG